MYGMNSDLYFDGKKFISASRGAKLTGYVTDYIGQLCRDGKLDCRMVGRSWYVSLDSLISHKNANGNGTKSRSQKHNKKAVLISAESFEKETLKIEQGEEFVVAPVESTVSDVVSVPSTVVAQIVEEEQHVIPVHVVSEEKVHVATTPFVSPITAFDIEISNRRAYNNAHKQFFFFAFPRLAAGMVALFVAMIGFWSALHINPDVEVAYNNVFHSLKEKSTNTFAYAGESLEANVFSALKPVVNDAGVAVYRTINGWIYQTQRRILVMAGKQPKVETVVEVPAEETNTKPSQGMVVVPTDEKTDRQAVVAKIKGSFSDEVTVEQSADGSNGVITPVFKKSKGDDYLYVLVPIKN
jgi:hypothetical protein